MIAENMMVVFGVREETAEDFLKLFLYNYIFFCYLHFAIFPNSIYLYCTARFIKPYRDPVYEYIRLR